MAIYEFPAATIGQLDLQYRYNPCVYIMLDRQIVSKPWKLLGNSTVFTITEKSTYSEMLNKVLKKCVPIFMADILSDKQ